MMKAEKSTDLMGMPAVTVVKIKLPYSKRTYTGYIDKSEKIKQKGTVAMWVPAKVGGGLVKTQVSRKLIVRRMTRK